MASLIQDVADTAFLVAHHRAVESARPDALFRDPLAAVLAGERGLALAKSMRAERMLRWVMAIRTPIIDRLVLQAVASGVDTVLNLGAGLDTRPYRLALPKALRWLEVDQPGLIAWKTEQLSKHTPVCRLERTGLDLTQAAARQAFLKAALADSTKALVLTEGVILYLETTAVAALADDLAAHPAVAQWIAEYVSPDTVAWRRRAHGDDMARAPFRFEPSDWWAFFSQHGWRPRETLYLPEQGRLLGRSMPLPWPIRLVMAVTRPFAPPARLRKLEQSTGYVLFERAPS